MGVTMDVEQPPSAELRKAVGAAWREFLGHTRTCKSTCPRGRDCSEAEPLKQALRDAREAAGFPVL